METFEAIVAVTVGSLAFWKVFLGCIWFVGIVAMGITEGGYRCLIFDFLGYHDGAGRSIAMVVGTILWLPLLVSDFVVMTYALVCFAVGRFGLFMEQR